MFAKERQDKWSTFRFFLGIRYQPYLAGLTDIPYKFPIKYGISKRRVSMLMVGKVEIRNLTILLHSVELMCARKTISK